MNHVFSGAMGEEEIYVGASEVIEVFCQACMRWIEEWDKGSECPGFHVAECGHG